MLFNSVFLILSLLAVVSATIKVNPSTHGFLDENGRTRIFRGVNAVYKISPWHPALTGYDSETTLSEADAALLHSWGFNIVRLGVMWPGVEPKKQGDYNEAYLRELDVIVKNLAKFDISVILDFHQDIWHRKFCGEGVPDYVFDICQQTEPEGTAPFPQPVVKDTYPLDEDGNPTLDACLSQSFAKYYLSAEVGAGFQCLYDNKNNLWDAFAGYWKTVVAYFKDSTNVLGYELINEPWAGDVYANPKSLLPQYAEKNYLQPLYEYLHQAIRTVDDEKIIFFEGLTIDYWHNGFTAGPGGADYNDRQALAYHIYCPSSNITSFKGQAFCAALDDTFFLLRKGDADRMQVGMIMTEFGAVEDTQPEVIALEKTAKLADQFAQSWMYWQFKYYQDLTTITPKGESLYNDDGTVNQHKLTVLSRTYPTAVAGELDRFEFFPENGLFELRYRLVDESSSYLTKSSNEDTFTTLVYANRDLHYQDGMHIELRGEVSDLVEVVCPSKTDNLIRIVQKTVAKATKDRDDRNNDDDILSVKISACKKKGDESEGLLCTCR